MRFHTNFHTEASIREAIDQINNGPRPEGWAPITLVKCEEHGSRSHKRAFEILLSGNGRYSSANAAVGGEAVDKGAEWDEWGTLMTTLYEDEYEGAWGPGGRIYRNAADFHDRTGYAFYAYCLPEDAHKRHHWIGGRCVKCSRTRSTYSIGFAAATA